MGRLCIPYLPSAIADLCETGREGGKISAPWRDAELLTVLFSNRLPHPTSVGSRLSSSHSAPSNASRRLFLLLSSKLPSTRYSISFSLPLSPCENPSRHPPPQPPFLFPDLPASSLSLPVSMLLRSATLLILSPSQSLSSRSPQPSRPALLSLLISPSLFLNLPASSLSLPVLILLRSAALLLLSPSRSLSSRSPQPSRPALLSLSISSSLFPDLPYSPSLVGLLSFSLFLSLCCIFFLRPASSLSLPISLPLELPHSPLPSHPPLPLDLFVPLSLSACLSFFARPPPALALSLRLRPPSFLSRCLSVSLLPVAGGH